MYNAQMTIERVQNAIKQNGDTQKHVLEFCGLSENTLKRMTDKTGMASFNLAKIADYLDCSVDYLLGRTDNPTSHKQNFEMVNNAPISGSYNMNVGNISVNKSELNSYQNELIQQFEKLTTIQQAKLLAFVRNVIDGKEKL